MLDTFDLVPPKLFAPILDAYAKNSITPQTSATKRPPKNLWIGCWGGHGGWGTSAGDSGGNGHGDSGGTGQGDSGGAGVASGDAASKANASIGWGRHGWWRGV